MIAYRIPVTKVVVNYCHFIPFLVSSLIVSAIVTVTYRPDPLTFLGSEFTPSIFTYGENSRPILRRLARWNRKCGVEVSEFFVPIGPPQRDIFKAAHLRQIPVPSDNELDENRVFHSSKEFMIPSYLPRGQWVYRAVNRISCWNTWPIEMTSETTFWVR